MKLNNFLKGKRTFSVKIQAYEYQKVTYLHSPGESYVRNVTLIPGEGIGRELVSIIKNIIISLIIFFHLRICIESK